MRGLAISGGLLLLVVAVVAAVAITERPRPLHRALGHAELAIRRLLERKPDFDAGDGFSAVRLGDTELRFPTNIAPRIHASADEPNKAVILNLDPVALRRSIPAMPLLGSRGSVAFAVDERSIGSCAHARASQEVPPDIAASYRGLRIETASGALDPATREFSGVLKPEAPTQTTSIRAGYDDVLQFIDLEDGRKALLCGNKTLLGQWQEAERAVHALYAAMRDPNAAWVPVR